MKSLNDFLSLLTDVWATEVFNMTVGDIFIAFAILYTFILLRQLVAKFILAWLSFLTSKSKSKLDDEIVESLEGPIRLLPVTLGVFISMQYLEVEGNFDVMMTNLVRSLIAITIFWSAFNLTSYFSNKLENRGRVLTSAMVDWLAKSVKAVFVLVGAATILEVWGIEVGPIIAGLGLFGVAVALGAQDLFKNLISGALVIAERRFNNGDWILVEGVVEGIVEKIGFRSTVIRRFDKAPVYVPNTKLSDTAVTNFSSMTHRRIFWTIGVEYKTTIEQLKQIRDGIEAYITENEDFTTPEEAAKFVRIDKFNDSSIDIMLYCFTKTTVWGEWLEIKEKLAYAIKDIVENAGTGFAFPSQSVYLESLPADQPEVFNPPKGKSIKKKASSKSIKTAKKKVVTTKLKAENDAKPENVVDKNQLNLLEV
ncbi:MAG: mechanosensitive ion channel protein MscS [Magnetococcales bacterium]|nr:mechanosensitive ion channel protein MscS [Magnetococcales bacterium]PPR19111.1 MAG: Low conductance mechanosensitive channel YnaI [Pseudomonadota bacterium]